MKIKTYEIYESGLTMKKIVIAGVCVLALGAAFVGGVLWEHKAHQAQIDDIEQAAIETHAKQLNALRKICKK